MFYIEQPHIRRTRPRTPIVRPRQALPVIATLHWLDGSDWKEDTTIEGLALAWSDESVQVEWVWNDKPRLDWMALDDVHTLRSQ